MYSERNRFLPSTAGVMRDVTCVTSKHNIFSSKCYSLYYKSVLVKDMKHDLTTKLIIDALYPGRIPNLLSVEESYWEY